MVTNIISRERLTKYLQEAGFDEEKALALYGWNIQISEAFFPLLSAAEVGLRNTICDRLQEMFGRDWWENDDFLQQIQRGKRIVKNAHDKLESKGSVTNGRMIAELNFGFWVKMLLPRHKEIFWPNFHSAFENLPKDISYETFYKRCEDIRVFRNRVFHHEPILHLNISQEYSDLMQMINWLSPEKAKWIKGYSRVMAVMRQKP